MITNITATATETINKQLPINFKILFLTNKFNEETIIELANITNEMAIREIANSLVEKNIFKLSTILK